MTLRYAHLALEHLRGEMLRTEKKLSEGRKTLPTEEVVAALDPERDSST